MANLSDAIESFILSMLKANDGMVELKRNELANYFGCVPSQINYVITTRFTLDKGYMIESKKGGGGYIRITKMDTNKVEYLNHLQQERIGNAISYKDASDIVTHLYNDGILTVSERDIVISVLKEIPMPVHSEYKDVLRAGIFKNIIVVILNKEEI